MFQKFKILSEQRKGVLALVVLAFVFASMGIFVRFLQTDFTLFQQTYLRIGLAFFLATALFYKDLRISYLSKIRLWDWGVILFRTIVLYAAILLVSEAYFSAKYSNVSFIAAAPLLPLFGYFLLREKITLEKLVWILLAFVGVALIGIKDFAHLFDWGRGEFLALLSAVFFNLSYVGRKWQSDFLNNKETTVLMFFFGSFFLFLTSFFVLEETLPTLSGLSFVAVATLLTAALFNVMNLFLTNYGFQKVEAHVAGNVLTLEVFFALLLGVFLYQEIPTTKELIGGVLVVWSVYQMNKLIR